MDSKRVRSPNYPALSLPEAIGRTENLYKELHRHGAPREDVARAMGYNTLNGASASAISALHKYGLIEGGGDNIKVTDRALRILHPHSPEERAEAMREAAREPQLFNELAERFPDGLRNEGIVRNYLIRQGFAPSAVPAVIAAYRETSELVGREGVAHDSPREQTREHDDMPNPQNQLREPPFTSPSIAPVIGLLADGRIVINTTLNDKEGVDDLIAKLSALRVIAPDRPKVDPQRAVEPPVQEARVSLMITQEQKAALRERGYTDEQIRDMKPEDAHRALGLIN